MFSSIKDTFDRLLANNQDTLSAEAVNQMSDHLLGAIEAYFRNTCYASTEHFIGAIAAFQVESIKLCAPAIVEDDMSGVKMSTKNVMRATYTLASIVMSEFLALLIIDPQNLHLPPNELRDKLLEAVGSQIKGAGENFNQNPNNARVKSWMEDWRDRYDT